MVKGRPAITGSRAFAELRPSIPAFAIDRPEVLERLTSSLSRFRVTVLLAPAGFGKTASLSAWASQTPKRVVWLSLTREDGHVEHLRRRLLPVLDTLTGPDAAGPDGSTDDVGAEAVLVIDDIQFADSPASRRMLGAVLEPRDPGVRIILAGRFDPKLGLSRLRVNGELGEIDAEALPFTVAEVQLAARALGRVLDAGAAAQLIEHTGGWPVAVRLALMSDVKQWLGSAGSGPGDHLPQFVDYLMENLLDQLPAALSAFLPRACVCDRLTGPLADELSGGSHGRELLEDAVDRGIPLERRVLPSGEAVYIWHPVMAQAGRALLMRRDPLLIRELHLIAARHLASTAPYAAALHAFDGRDHQLVADIIRSHWLALVLRGDSEVVDELCGRLPSPWSDDPEILTVVATCRRNSGAAEIAAQYDRRAVAGAQHLDARNQQRFEVTHRLGQLFLADSEADLLSACDAMQSFLEGSAGLVGSQRACTLLLLGASKARLRRSQEAISLLSEAIVRCKAEGLDDLEDRARASLTFSRAFDGDFAGALAGIQAARSSGDDRTWRRTDGAVEAFTEGWINFWRGEPDSAMAALRDAVAHGGALTSFEPIARVWMVLAALTRGIPGEIAEAEQVLQLVPEATIQGLPWRHYKLIAEAGIKIYRGEMGKAITLLDEGVAIDAFIPAIRVHAAEFYWLCGRPANTLAQLPQVLTGPGYLRASGLVLSALCARLDGDDAAAGTLLEEALGLATRLGITRPFRLGDPAMAGLLRHHGSRGTRFEGFLAEQVAWHSRQGTAGPLRLLSGREREILSYLGTRMSVDEISDALFVSPNTVKTHLKSIYRKLGVDNRRDAAHRSQTS